MSLVDKLEQRPGRTRRPETLRVELYAEIYTNFPLYISPQETFCISLMKEEQMNVLAHCLVSLMKMRRPSY